MVEKGFWTKSTCRLDALFSTLLAPPYPRASPEPTFQLKINQNNTNNQLITPRAAR